MAARAFFSLFILCAVFPRAPLEAQSPALRHVAGTIVDAHTGVGLAGVRVRLIPRPDGARPAAPDGQPSAGRETISDAAGAFAFEAVASGRYRIAVALEGFQPFTDPRDVVVAEDVDPPAAVVSYALRMTAEVQAYAAVERPDESVAGSAMNTIPGRAIVVAPGALEDVMRTFQSRPGVAASQDDRNDMLVRGGGAIENATRIDGFDVPNPSHFGTPGSSGGAFSILPPWLIERAVLRAGGFSVEFGERASSVLDLSLKPVAKDRVHGQAGASVGGAMGEVEGSFDRGRGSWLVSARRSFLELAFSRGSDRAVPHYSDLVARLDYVLSGKHRLEVFGLGSRDDVVVTSTGSNAINDDQTMTMIGVSIRSQWTAQTATAVFASYARTDIDADVGGASSSDGSDHSTEVELRLRGEVRRRLGRGAEVMAGVAVKRPDLLFGLDAKGFHNSFGSYIAPLDSHFRYSFRDGSAYSELRLSPFARLQLTPGLRLDHAGTTGRVYASPRVNGEYRARDWIQLTGAYGIYRQALPYVWIGSNIRNASLDPVRARQALAGICIRPLARTTVLLEGFDKRYTGYPIDYRAQPWHVLLDAAADYESPFVGALSPAGSINARGIDTSIQRAFANGIHVEATYSYWRVEQFSAYGAGYQPWHRWLRADYDIRHQARLQVAYETAGKWRFATMFRYASGRPYTPYDTAASSRLRTGTIDLWSFNAATLPPYHRLDVRVDRTFALGRTRLMVYGEIDNVYDRDNLYAYEWNRVARQPRAIYQWGRLPVAGVRWEF